MEAASVRCTLTPPTIAVAPARRAPVPWLHRQCPHCPLRARGAHKKNKREGKLRFLPHAPRDNADNLPQGEHTLPYQRSPCAALGVRIVPCARARPLGSPLGRCKNARNGLTGIGTPIRLPLSAIGKLDMNLRIDDPLQLFLWLFRQSPLHPAECFQLLENL